MHWSQKNLFYFELYCSKSCSAHDLNFKGNILSILKIAGDKLLRCVLTECWTDFCRCMILYRVLKNWKIFAPDREKWSEGAYRRSWKERLRLKGNERKNQTCWDQTEARLWDKHSHFNACDDPRWYNVLATPLSSKHYLKTKSRPSNGTLKFPKWA